MCTHCTENMSCLKCNAPCCVESGAASAYRDESSKTLWQRLMALLPSSSQTGVAVNAVTLAGVVYAVKLLRDDDDDDDVISAIAANATNSTA